MNIKVLVAAGLTVSTLQGCASTAQTFHTNPASVSNVDLCHSAERAKDPRLQQDMSAELARRGLTSAACSKLITDRNIKLGAIAAVGIGALVLASRAPSYGGGGGYYPAFAWDEFYGQFGQLIWVCRDTRTGEFAELYHCPGPQNDFTWPSKQASAQ